MIELNVLELLKKKGQTKYWLWKQLNITYTNFNDMINNKRSSIKYSNIEKLCDILECTPNELFKKVETPTFSDNKDED